VGIYIMMSTVMNRSPAGLQCGSVLVLLILVFTAPLAHAIRVSGLYEAEVPVAGQQVRDRALAFQEGMRMVLVKLTGDRYAASQAELQSLIRDAERYILQYRYVEARVGADTPPGTPVRLNLKIWFDEAGLNNALRNMDINIWGRERPSVLVWLAMENDNIRRILRLEEDPEYFAIMDQKARSRGIVLLFPLFDLEDTANLQIGDIWAGFHGQVINASRRYFPDIILTGRIESPVDGIWEGLWTAYFGTDARTWTTEGSFAETVLNEGMDGIADLLAMEFARGTSQTAGDIEMRVIDVINPEQYSRVLGYLRSLSPVTRVDVTQVSQAGVVFRLSAHGGEGAVTQAIHFGRTLEPVDERNNIYRLLP